MTKMENFKSKSPVRIRPSELHDLCVMKDKLRPEHVDEIYASHHYDAEMGLLVSYAVSDECYTVEYRGVPFAIFGVQRDGKSPDSGSFWLLCTTDADHVPRSLFQRISQHAVSVMLSRYKLLYNWADARYTTSIQWLRSLGADVHEPLAYGAEALPFHFFTFNRGT